MSTIHDGKATIERIRKRPTNADAITKRTWGQAFQKPLEIPIFIDGYNNHMGGVDQADQARAECPISRRTYLTWKPCAAYLIDTALCNMAHIWDAYGHFDNTGRRGLHATFRKELATKLMAYNRAKPYTSTHRGPPGKRTVLANTVASTEHYGKLVKAPKKSPNQAYCKACQAASRYAMKRIKLVEISTNIASKRQAPRTSYICSQCNIALCGSGPCWQEHLDAICSN